MSDFCFRYLGLLYQKYCPFWSKRLGRFLSKEISLFIKEVFVRHFSWEPTSLLNPHPVSNLETLDIEVPNKQYSLQFYQRIFIQLWNKISNISHFWSWTSNVLKPCAFNFINQMLRDDREWSAKLLFDVVMRCFIW